MKTLLSLCFLLAICIASFGQAKGKVFSDINKNQLADADEPGIENVLVSNGTDVVKTDKNGNYQIPIKSGNILFVIKPQGWCTPLNKYKLSKFYYIYKPDGSPVLKVAGSMPTGPLPDHINFPLYPTKEPDNFELFVMGDLQPSNAREAEYLAKNIISEVANDTIRKFGISLGDVVSNNIEDYPMINDIVSKIGIPFYHAIGNHDLNFDAPTDELTDETFEATFGPTTYAFQYAKTHFIILDDVIYGDIDTRKYTGGLRDDQLTHAYSSFQRSC